LGFWDFGILGFWDFGILGFLASQLFHGNWLAKNSQNHKKYSVINQSNGKNKIIEAIQFCH